MNGAAARQAIVEPYVGMRPFEPDEAEIFFGRERDASLLVNKVLASRLTVLYAQSGVGKSSLLRVLAIPQMERDEGAIVVHHDAWAGDDPLASLTGSMVARARLLGQESAGAGAPTLCELSAILSTITPEPSPVVLVLDQFEELLFHHATRLDPLKRQLAEVVRAGHIDVRVLISMREEFLAALEPFRHDLTDLFRSTFRLEPLAGERLEEAIRLPARAFGVEWEDGLVDRLLRDLGAAARDASSVGDRVVELPFVQLVCRELWRSVRPEPGTSMDLLSYETRGSAAGILEKYLREVMPGGPVARLRVARLIQHLAPPSGVKISLSAVDLAEDVGGSPENVERRLKHLEHHRILHSRDYRGVRRFELQHDALIPVLRGWRDRILRRWTYVRVAAVVLVLAAVAGVLWTVRSFQAQEHQKQVVQRAAAALHDATYGAVDAAAREEALGLRSRRLTAAFDGAVTYALGRAPVDEDFDYLHRFLIDSKSHIPEDYAQDTSIDDWLIPAEADWPVRVVVSDSRDLQARAFYRQWLVLAKQMAASLNLPLPRRVYLTESATMPQGLIEVGVQGLVPVRVEVPTLENSAILCSTDELGGAGRRFLKRFAKEFPTAETHANDSCFVVPRWSLPVWRMTGGQPVDGSQHTANEVLTGLKHHPEILFNDGALAAMVAPLAKEHTQVVAEAFAARGPKVAADLVHLLRRGVALRCLGQWLDAFADVADEPSEALAQEVIDRVREGRAAPVGRLHGPRWPQSGSPPRPSLALRRAYDEVADWVSTPKQPIRVHIGADVQRWWIGLTASGGDIGAKAQNAIASVRREFLEREGLIVPGVQMVGDPALDAASIRFELFHQGQTGIEEPGAQPIVLEQVTSLKVFMDQLSMRLQRLHVLVVDADHVDRRLRELPAPLARWIRARYGLTDLKQLMRAMLAPPDEPASTEDKATRSIANLPWLLGSLVFWASAEDGLDGPGILRFWRGLQRNARAERPADSLTLAPVHEGRLRRGIEALAAGDLDVAESAFRRPAGVSRSAWAERFAVLYASTRWEAAKRRLQQACLGSPKGNLDPFDWAELERWMADDGFTGTPRERLGYDLCLLQSYRFDVSPAHVHDLAARMIGRYEPAAQWSDEALRWFVTSVLQHYDPEFGSPQLLAGTEALFEALLARSSPADRAARFYEVQKECDRPAAPCYGVLDRLVQRSPDPVLWYLWAEALLADSRPGPLHEALELAGRLAQRPADATIGAMPVSTAARSIELRARCALVVYRYSTDDVPSLLEGLRSLTRQDSVEAPAKSALVDLLKASADTAHLEDATRVIAEDLATDPGRWERWQATLLVLHLARADTRGLATLATRAREEAGAATEVRSKQSALFVAALAALLSRSDRAEAIAREFFQTKHEYADYVRLLLASTKGPVGRVEASDFLALRWKWANPVTWDRRLRTGDPSPWREMLVGYALGKPESQDALRVVEDAERYATSPLSGLPMGQNGLLCEAYFYDALRLHLQGDAEGSRRALERTVSLQMTNYFEHWMAVFFLKTGMPGASP